MVELRKVFRREIKRMKKDLLDLGRMAERAIQNSIEAVEKKDLELAEIVLKEDGLIDKKTLELEERGMKIAATQFPVAKDLRLIYSILFMSIHFERMGDLAFNIAKIIKHISETSGKDEEFIVRVVTKMGNETRTLVSLSLKAFEENDVELAKKLPSYDEPIDNLYKEFFKEVARVSLKEHSLDWAASMVLITRYLERIADHAVDIGERVSFIVTGELEGFSSDVDKKQY
ncbi:MAG: phosphate signaling complex protein PhoU [Actinomycetia bacterium]|nr:phosphate signaling complex protein PhoU [Actinomycetes bacterium]